MARRIEEVRRSRGNRKTKETILFEFEGYNNKTEEIYFKHFQKRSNPYNIKFAYGHNTNPIGMIKSLIDYMKKEDISIENNDKIYCVFDADVDVNKQKEIDEAIRLAEEYGIEIIISNPSFEIWYRMHFDYTTKNFVSNRELITDLRTFIPNYEKNLDVYAELEKDIPKAISNSKRLEKFQKQNGKRITDIDCNPYTSVYKVVEYLLRRSNDEL